MVQFDLSGQHILVTGGSDGIGKEIAATLMKMGAHVAVHYHSNEVSAGKLIEDQGNSGSSCFKADFKNPVEVIRLWDQVLDKYQRIDSVVFNAGVYQKQPIADPIEKWHNTWKDTMTINLESPALLTKLTVDHFAEKDRGGRLIYMASRAVFRGETPEYLAYAASKGGLVSLGRSVARSFGKSNIKSFILAPGFVKTKMAEQFIEDYGEQKVMEELALNKLTTPKDIAPLVAMLCSGSMDHATGATIDINAGSHIR